MQVWQVLRLAFFGRRKEQDFRDRPYQEQSATIARQDSPRKAENFILTAPVTVKSEPAVKQRPVEDIVCQVCFEKASPESAIWGSIATTCVHEGLDVICVPCLRQLITSRAESLGAGLGIKCWYTRCPTYLDMKAIRRFADPEVVDRMSRQREIREEPPAVQAQWTDVLFNENARFRGVKRCPKCTKVIQKSGGCDHMICLGGCGHQFCWLCLAEWKGVSMRHYEFCRHFR
jgi:hypothetical protein